MKTQLIAGPAFLPLSLASLKDHLRVTGADDDSYISSVLMTAVTRAEQLTRRRLITQTWNIYLDDFPVFPFIGLPFGRLQSVTHIKYTDYNGDQSTMDAVDYIAAVVPDPGLICLAYGAEWPTDELYPSNPIEIQFVCGYGSHTPLTITDASEASPIVIESASHGLSSLDRVLVEGVGGNTAANGVWFVTKVDDDNFSLNGSTGNAEYTSGGTATKQDVPQAIIQAIKIIAADLYEHREDSSDKIFHRAGVVNRLLVPFVINHF